MKILKWFYIIITVLYIFGVFLNLNSGKADGYQILEAFAYGIGWYLIEKK